MRNFLLGVKQQLLTHSKMDIWCKSSLQFFTSQLPLTVTREDKWGMSWSWSCGNWIYNYLCSQCLSPLRLWVKIPLMVRCTHTTLCDKVCQWLFAGRWFSPGILVSSDNKTDCHDISNNWNIVQSGVLHQNTVRS